MQRFAYWRNTTFKLFSLISFMYPIILNVLNMARGEAKENYLSRQVSMRPEQQTTSPENPHMHIYGFGTVLT